MMPRKPKATKTETVFTFVPRPEPRFPVGAYALTGGETVVVGIVEWLPKVGWIYYLTAKLARYRLSVFSEREFEGFGARLMREAA